MAAESVQTGRNWPDLRTELLGSILERLTVPDYIRFGAVCFSWHSVFAQKFWRPARQVPWLMSPGNNSEVRNFISLSEKKTYKIHLPEIQGLRCVGSTEGWLVYVDDYAELHLLNPLNRSSRYTLPSITSLYGMDRIERDPDGIDSYWFSEGFDDPEAYEYTREETAELFHYKVVMTASPSSGNCRVVSIHNISKRLAFAKPGDETWTVLNAPFKMFDDVIFYKGLIYAVTNFGDVLTCDLSDPSSPPKLGTIQPGSKPGVQMMYLVELSGDLLRAGRRYTHFGGVVATYLFEIWKLDPSTSMWVEVKSLGDYALFLGYNRSMALSTKDFPELRPNCIYFTDDDREMHLQDKEEPRDMGIYNLEGGCIESFLPDDSPLTWPPSVWVQPSLF